MSNFQRSRSKVWWGDSPPNIGSPVAQASNWNQNNQNPQQDDWEPQLPQWIGDNPEQPTVNETREMSPKEVAVNPWPLRHGSPGSHKSQDSGFSDSDSSPPVSQYYPSPDNAKSNKSSSSSDSNNNENITVKQVIDFKDTPKSTTNLDVPDSAATNKTSNTRLRSTSVIQTPYDFQKYMEVHGDGEHVKLLNESENISHSDVKITLTPPENNNNKNVDTAASKPVVPKKSNSSKEIKVAKVKDLETIKTKSQESLEYLQVSEMDHIAVNNLPRIRSPISSVPFVPEPDYDQDTPKRVNYSRSTSQQDRKQSCDDTKFQRNRLNKSLNYEGQRLDQQILDIQEGYHSLGYVNEDFRLSTATEEVHTPRTRGFNIRNVTDSLQLKPHKKCGPKHKYKSTPKLKQNTCSFRIFNTKKEKPAVVDAVAGGILEGSRVPSLGLPRYKEQDQWVMVGFPEEEKLVHNERLVGTQSEVDQHAKLYAIKDQSKAAEIKRIPPPSQFEDRKEETSKSLSRISDAHLTHDSKKEKLKVSTESFNVNLNMECTSTPKMLAPHEYMYHVSATPQIPGKNTRLRRVNLLDNFNGNASPTEPPNNYQGLIEGETALERLCAGQQDSVQYWLCEIVGSYENECMTTLQSKALGLEQQALVTSSSATITGNIKKVQTHGQIIVHLYSDLLCQLEKDPLGVQESLCLLVANVNEFVLTHSITLNTRPPKETPERWDRVKASLQGYLQRLVEIGEDIKTELNDSNTDWRVLRNHLASMLTIFEETTKAVLVQQLRTLVSIIEEPPSDVILKSTLTSISHLASTPPADFQLHDLCEALLSSVTVLPFVECAVPRALLTAVIETNKNSVKALALRALATICVTAEAVKQFEESGGMEIVAEMLTDSALPEPAAREAATVLAQTTAPWRRGADPAPLHNHLAAIVAGLTRIISQTECCQLLLLCTACLVNIVREVELDGAVTQTQSDEVDLAAILSKNRTVERLLDAVKRRGPEVSVFLQEQTAALLSGLSQSRCAGEVTRARAAPLALVCLARVSHAPGLQLEPRERDATDRMLRHTVEAMSRVAITMPLVMIKSFLKVAKSYFGERNRLARLCVLPELSSQIVQLEGVPRLIRLVRMHRSREHNNSTTEETLVYALKTLRTINKHCPEAFVNQPSDVREMIDGHLMQSVMKFSSKKESYV